MPIHVFNLHNDVSEEFTYSRSPLPLLHFDYVSLKGVESSSASNEMDGFMFSE